MGNGISTPSLIPGLSQIEDSILNLQRLISQLGSLPENAISILNDIRNRLLQITQDVQSNIRNAISDIRDQFSTITQQIINRIDEITQSVELTVSQLSDLLSEISPTIPVLRELIISLEDVPKVISNLPTLLIGGLITILLFIGISILLYKFIMEGTSRLGIDNLLVTGSMIVILSILLILIFLYMKNQFRNIKNE